MSTQTVKTVDCPVCDGYGAFTIVVTGTCFNKGDSDECDCGYCTNNQLSLKSNRDCEHCNGTGEVKA